MDRGVIEYAPGRGRAEAIFADPGRDASAVIVLHEVWGATPFIEDVCVRLARLGFAAYAPILYWRHIELFSRENIREAMGVVWNLSLAERYDSRKLGSALRKEKASAEVRRLLTTLYDRSYRSLLLDDVVELAREASRARPAVGALGYSRGGRLALWLASRF